MRTAENIVNQEVFYCVSGPVSTLAAGYGDTGQANDLAQLAEQAYDLACPIDDWEEAAIQEGWVRSDTGAIVRADALDAEGYRVEDESPDYADWQECCEAEGIEPYQREVFEHWIVSDWLADRLAEKGEKVDKDFAGLTVWARTTTGQGIASDSVIEAIAADLNK